MSVIPAEPKHPIQIVTRRTGLSADVLRAWERRYGAVTPDRTAPRRRLYSDRDIERLTLLRQATEAGRPIRQIAALPDEQLRRIVSGDVDAAVRRIADRPVAPPSAVPQGFVAQAFDAVGQLDSSKLHAALTAASLALSPADLMERVMVPLMRAVGTGWERGTLGIAHEHLATAIIRAMLSGIVLSRDLPGSGPGIVVTTPRRQVHELGALVVTATAASVGWRVTYLGIDIPAESIAEAAAKSGAEVVALSMTHPHDDPDLPGELTRLRERLPARVTILAGGLAAPAYATALDEIGALVLRDMQSLRTVLTSLRSENGGLAA